MVGINGRLLSLAFVFATGLVAPSSAQAQQWRVSQNDPSQPAVAIAPGTGTVVGMGLQCVEAQPAMMVTLARSPGRVNGPMVFSIDGESFPVQLDLVGQPATFAGLFENELLIDALAWGQTVEVAINGRSVGSVSLSGSSAAFTSVLYGCWQGASGAQSELVEEPRPDVPPAQRSAIMRAAGFVQRGQQWTTCEGEETGDIEQFRDLNGDGTQEALVTSYGIACHGFGGSGFTLLTQDRGGWRIMYQQSGIPEFFERPGIAWPDIEIGGPGSDCFPFLRWDGQGYVDGGTSLGGEICTLRPRFAAGTPPPAANPQGANEGILGQVPIRLGYYVLDGERCDRPAYLYKFERNRHFEIYSESGRVDALTTPYGRVSGPAGGFYYLTLADPGPEDPESIGIRPVFAGRIELEVQDRVELIHCPENQIPRAWRR